MLVTTLAALAFSFPGGGEVELVNEIARTFDANVVLLAHGERSWRSSEFEEDRDSSLRRRVAATFGLRGSTANEWVIAPKSWPFHLVHKQNVGRYVNRFSSSPGTRVVNSDRVTLGPSRYEQVIPPRPYPTSRFPVGYELKDLRPLTLSKPVAWHWFFDEARFLMHVDQVPKLSLWNMVAKAAGGRWTAEPKRYFIDLDLQEFRDRWHAVSDADTPRLAPVHRSRTRFTALSFDLLNDQELKGLMSSKAGIVERDIQPGTPLAREAQKVLAWARSTGFVMSDDSLARHPSGQLRMKVVIFASKTSALKVSSRDGTRKFVL